MDSTTLYSSSITSTKNAIVDARQETQSSTNARRQKVDGSRRTFRELPARLEIEWDEDAHEILPDEQRVVDAS